MLNFVAICKGMSTILDTSDELPVALWWKTSKISEKMAQKKINTHAKMCLILCAETNSFELGI